MELRFFFFPPALKKKNQVSFSLEKRTQHFFRKLYFFVNIFLCIADCSVPTALDGISPVRGLKAL